MNYRGKMVLYHGTGSFFEEPDIYRGRRDTDFGIGFYLTTDVEQAAKLACKKANSCINKYEIDFDKFRVYEFGENREWLDFVVKNRDGIFDKTYSEYDILIGATADDRLFDTLSEYKRDKWSPDEMIELLTIAGYDKQIVIKRDIPDGGLTFQGRQIMDEKEVEKWMSIASRERDEIVEKTEKMKDDLRAERNYKFYER